MKNQRISKIVIATAVVLGLLLLLNYLLFQSIKSQKDPSSPSVSSSGLEQAKPNAVSPAIKTPSDRNASPARPKAASSQKRDVILIQ